MRFKTLEDVQNILSKKGIQKTSLALRKRAVIFKGRNVEFNPITMEATSYNWWYFVKRIGNVVVFNNYCYSNCTSKHQRKVRDVMFDLGIKYITIHAPKGLQNIQSAVDHYQYQIKELEAAINKPKSRKATNARRMQRIAELKNSILQVKDLMRVKSQIPDRMAA